MHFHFCVFNHNEIGRQTLLDMYQWLEAGLGELGHDVTLSDQLDKSAVNVVWEYFKPGIGEALSESGVHYGIIVTEFMDGEGFNRGNPRSSRADRRDADYTQRWTGFNAATKGATFLWSMVESNVEPLRSLLPTGFVELGFSDRLLPAARDVAPDLDFSFTGIVTPHRQRMLERLSERADVVWPLNIVPIGERDQLLLRTRINLSINKTADWQMPSPTRVGRVLLACRGIALDYTPQRTRQSSLLESCPRDADFVEFALQQLATDWPSAAQTALERYREELPMRALTEQLLEQTLPAH